MSNNEILVGADPDAKLDTGMKVSEAAQRTRNWWEGRGRALMEEQKIHQTQAMRTPFATADPDSGNFMPSGIINGLEWDALSKREKLRLIKFWHHFNVRMQDLIGTPEHEYKFGQGGSVQ